MMKMPLLPVFVALLLAATVFADMPAVNVKFDSDSQGMRAKNITVGEDYFFNVRLYDINGQEANWVPGSSPRCVVAGGVGEANASTGCLFYAKKAGKGTLTYFYRAANFGYDLSATINITVDAARCKITPVLPDLYPLQKMRIAAECSSLNGTKTNCPELTWHASGGNFSNQHEAYTNTRVKSQAVDYTASQYAGKHKIYATDGELGDASATYCEMSVEVMPGAVSKVVIAPNSADELDVGQSISFIATAMDINTNKINDSKITWSVNGSIGNVDQGGVFTANRSGRGAVRATAACPFMAAGCPFASIDVVVRGQQAAPPAPPEMPPTGNEMPPAPPSAAQAPAQSQQAAGQQQAASASPQGIDIPQAGAIALAAVLGLAAAFFLLTARKKRR